MSEVVVQTDSRTGEVNSNMSPRVVILRRGLECPNKMASVNSNQISSNEAHRERYDLQQRQNESSAVALVSHCSH